MSEQGEEAPAESFATAKLRADVARQQMRLAKEQLKRARKRFKEARREARQARKLAAMARRAWKKARRGGKGGDARAKSVAKPVKVAGDVAPPVSRRGQRGRAAVKRVGKSARKPGRPKGRRRGRGGKSARRSRAS